MFHFKRVLGYALGFVLFYAPFALFQRALNFLLTGESRVQTIHSLCLRIPTEHLLDGKIFRYASGSVVSTIILLVVAVFFGAIFCGRLCPAGALTEFLSKLVPARLQINWRSFTEIAPIRYGMLAGFCLVPFVDGLLACAYCNFFLFDLIINYYARGYFIALSSSLILTAILWLVIFGAFTKGGRGFCNFLCPVGAVQNLVSVLTQKFPFVWRMRVNTAKCIGCGKCVQKCPMESITLADGKAQLCAHNCIACGVCEHTCPVHAVSYGRKNDEK